MAMHQGKCRNFGNCDNADKRTQIEVPDGADFTCPVCGRPLERIGQSTSKPVSKLLVVALALALILCIAGYLAYKKFSASDTSDLAGILGRPLRVGIVTWPGYAGGIVANNGFKPTQDSIYFKRHKLYVEFLLMEDVDARAKAFARGGKDGVDIVWSTVDFWANELPGFVKNDIKAKAIMQVDWSRGGDAMVADRSITKVEDLYGKKISLALFTPSHWLLEYSLQNSSLDEAKQNQIVKSLIGKNSSPDARADFVAGKVDAAVVWEPDVTEALQKRPNSHIVVSSREASKLIADVMVAREDFIREHPDVIEAFVKGWVVEGTEEASRNPDLVTKLLMQNEPVYKDLGIEKTKGSLSTVKWADLTDNTEMFNLDDKAPQALFDRLFIQAGKSWVARGYISAPTSPAIAKDDSFLRKLYQQTPVDRTESSMKPAPMEDAKKLSDIFQKQITVNFATGSAELSPEANSVIDNQVSLLPTTFSGTHIRVEGNTDNVGDPDSNRALSQRRAQAVVDHLVSKYGLPRDQFIAVGNGPDKEVASNDTVEGRAKNRRTDVGPTSR